MHGQVASTLNADDENQTSDGVANADGIFWMLWEDFAASYNNIEVCRTLPSIKLLLCAQYVRHLVVSDVLWRAGLRQEAIAEGSHPASA